MATTTAVSAEWAPCDKHEIINCRVCSGRLEEHEIVKPGTIKVAHPDPLWIWPRQPAKSRDVRIAQLVADRKMCGSCLTMHKPIGCQCSREATHQTNMVNAAGFAHAAITGDEDERLADTDKANGRMAVGLMFAASARSQRRAGLAPDAIDDERTGLLEEFGDEVEIKPTWRQYRRQEADHLPV